MPWTISIIQGDPSCDLHDARQSKPEEVTARLAAIFSRLLYTSASFSLKKSLWNSELGWSIGGRACTSIIYTMWSRKMTGGFAEWSGLTEGGGCKTHTLQSLRRRGHSNTFMSKILEKLSHACRLKH